MTKYDKGLHIEIGKQLKEARIKKGMSLQNMSDAIGGIKTKQSIMRYENGESSDIYGILSCVAMHCHILPFSVMRCHEQIWFF